ncbi:MAG: glycosyltransferase [Saprospiraceae bacterium]|nr:glycosyltransferase [Saprospiraceae bacterium]
MNPDIDIVYFSLFPWDHPYSSVSLSFAKEFAKHNRVFYINHPLTYKDFLSRYQEPAVQNRKKNLWRGKLQYDTTPHLPDNIIAVQPPNTIPINFLPFGKWYTSLYQRNNQLILKAIQQIIDDYSLKNFIYINCFNPFYAGVLPKSMGAQLSIYQCIDDMMEEEYTARHGNRLEEQAIANADVAFVTSTNLYKLKSHLNPETYILHNAADIDIFMRTTQENLPRPAEIQNVQTPIIGFMGNLNEYRVDYALLRKIALSHTDKTLLLIGPLNSDDYKHHGLDQLPNVILTGGKNIKELPQYLRYMDCALIPFRVNKQTASVYPLKINEYLAAGRSVISSSFSDDIRSFESQILLANDHDHFIQLIDQAIAANQPQQVAERIALAQTNTWTARVAQFWDIVTPKLKNIKTEQQPSS